MHLQEIAGRCKAIMVPVPYRFVLLFVYSRFSLPLAHGV